MPADIAWPHDENLTADRRFHFASHDVGDRFMRVCVERCADPGCVADLKKGHGIALDQGFHREFPAIGRLTLDRADPDLRDLGISGTYHLHLPDTDPVSTAPDCSLRIAGQSGNSAHFFR